MEIFNLSCINYETGAKKSFLYKNKNKDKYIKKIRIKIKIKMFNPIRLIVISNKFHSIQINYYYNFE